jgi:hypothetical protein
MAAHTLDDVREIQDWDRGSGVGCDVAGWCVTWRVWCGGGVVGMWWGVVEVWCGCGGGVVGVWCGCGGHVVGMWWGVVGVWWACSVGVVGM